MPHIDRLFGEFANVTKLSGREITSADVKQADALLVRSITKVDQNLLDDSHVKYVGTATIGIDHLDTDWLALNSINWSSAAGCNAAAVAQYVISGICHWLKFHPSLNLQQLTVGIVGAGNVGTELARCLEILGVKYLLCDPPLERTDDSRVFHSIDKLLDCDVITYHVPITREGIDRTFHLVDKHFLQQLSSEQLLINAARGEVADNDALFDYLKEENSASVILDVFEVEPNVNYELAKLCLLSTPHIAGHTLEGKLRGSYLVYQAFCQCFGLPIAIKQNELFPDINHFDGALLDLSALLLSLYDIEKDSKRLLSVDKNDIAEHFDQMRKNYVNSFDELPRRDYSGWQIENCVEESINLLTSK